MKTIADEKELLAYVEENYFTNKYYGTEDEAEYIAVSVRCDRDIAKRYAALLLGCIDSLPDEAPGVYYATDEALYDRDPKVVSSRVHVFRVKKQKPENTYLPYRIIGLDMDGTLLTSDKKILPQTLADLKWIADKGVYLAYSTGRALVEMTEYFAQTPMIRYAICYSGAIIYDCLEKKVIYRNEVTSDCFDKIISVAEKYNGMLTFLTETESIVSANDIHHMDDFHMGVYQPMYLRVTRQVEDMRLESHAHESITKINIYFRNIEDRHRGYEELKDLPLTFALAEETSLEMNAKGVSKGAALLMLSSMLNIPKEQTMAIGDADNDRDMLSRAELSVVMGNARSDIKKLAHIVTNTNDANGVGEAIRGIFT